MNLLKFCNKHLILVTLAIPLLFASCSTPKNIPYFKNVPDSGVLKTVEVAQFKDPLIKSDDILTVSMQVIDPSITGAINQQQSAAPGGATAAGGGTSSVLAQAPVGYLVNKQGYIELPFAGPVKVDGLTTSAAADTIQKKESKYMQNVTVQVRFANYKITVLGEVNKPASYIVPNEKITVLDAIGMAGDLTIYGKRDNVLVIRDVEGKKEMVRLNLTSSDLFKSPYFYLRQNDVVYVEPGKARIAQNNAAKVQAITIGVSILSLIAIILTRVK